MRKNTFCPFYNTNTQLMYYLMTCMYNGFSWTLVTSFIPHGVKKKGLVIGVHKK